MTSRKPNKQISGATIQNLVAWPTWRPEFVPAHYEGSYAGSEENHEHELVGDVDIFVTRRFNKTVQFMHINLLISGKCLMPRIISMILSDQ